MDTKATMEQALCNLLAKQDITELLTRYMRAVDRGDVDTLRACYLPGATEDHGGLYIGPADAYVKSIAKGIGHPKSLTTHAITNVLVDVEGEEARAECYVLAFARVRRSDGTIGDTLTSVRMVDRLQLLDGRWGIAHRTLRWDWNHDMEPAETWAFGMLGDPSLIRRSAKYPDDVLYQEHS